MEFLKADLSRANTHVIEDLALGEAFVGGPTQVWVQLQKVFHDIGDFLGARCQLLGHDVSSLFYG